MSPGIFTGYPVCYLPADIRELLASLIHSCSQDDIQSYVIYASKSASEDVAKGKWDFFAIHKCDRFGNVPSKIMLYFYYVRHKDIDIKCEDKKIMALLGLFVFYYVCC